MTNSGHLSTKDFSAASTTGAGSKPGFELNKTPKLRYRETFRIWTKRLSVLAQLDLKTKEYIHKAGHSRYDPCDSLVRDRILEAEGNCSVTLEDVNLDSDRVALIESIISVLVESTSTDILQREFYLLKDIYSFVQGHRSHLHRFRTGLLALLPGILYKQVSWTVPLATSLQF